MFRNQVIWKILSASGSHLVCNNRQENGLLCMAYLKIKETDTNE
jgi:hypothetical protein